jgi:hypothetical protein
MSKIAQIQRLTSNAEVVLNLKLECVVCENKITLEKEDFDSSDDKVENIQAELAKEAYKEGWRESSSEVFGHIGIHCPTCHKNRNNSKHFE